MLDKNIPTIDDLTAGWFTDLLRVAGALDGAAAVASVDLSPFGSDESMMSSLFRAGLTYEPADAGPESLIVKLASPSEEQRFIASMTKFYEREIRFYNEIADQMSVATPRCYLAEINTDDQSFVLVLEELAGRRQVDQIDGVGYDDAVVALTELADFHVPFWGKNLDSEAETFMRFDSPMLQAVLPDMFDGQWATTRAKVVDVLCDEVLAMCDNRNQHTADILRGMHGIDTLCHGDFRSDNLLFGSNGTVLALDYQLGSVCHGMTDVAYFIGQSVDDEVAAVRADALIKVYVDRLATHGIDLDMGEAMDRYRAGLVFYLSIPVGMLALDAVPERALELGRVMLRRASAEILRTGAHLQFG
ncbi:MAG: phosphotransferase [Ilumatobacter sp.]